MSKFKTKTWWWAAVTREDEPETNKDRCDAILTANGVEVDIESSDPANGCYLILLPRFPDTIEVCEMQLRVGELEIVIES